MPAPVTNTDFLDVVRQSGVLEAQRLDGYLQRFATGTALPDQPGQLAGLLVRDGLLTHFQAERFLQGKWRHFLIGKYKVLECLGSGGMCSVYLCAHRFMRRRAAIKVLPSAQAQDPAVLNRFYREARAVAALDHPNIVRAYDIDHDDNLHFLVMEYVEGASLQEIVQRHGRLDVLRAAHYVRQAASGLAHAHEHGLIHRDIKPSNLLLDRQGSIKVLDLGLARFFNDETDALTREHNEVVLGTADYLSPEQAVDSHTVDIRADIYSLGMTFYFLLAATTPFPGGTTAQKLIWHQMRKPKPIRDVRPEVPEELAAVIHKMLAKDPADRYANPAIVVAALAPWVKTAIPPPPEHEMPRLSPATQTFAAQEVPVPAAPETAIFAQPAAVGAALPTAVLAAALPAAVAVEAISAQPPANDYSTVPTGSPIIASPVPSGGATEVLIAPHRPSATARKRPWLLAGFVAAGIVLLVLAVLVLTLSGLRPPTTDGGGLSPSQRSLVETTLAKLTAQPQDPKLDPVRFRQDVFAFLQAYPGTPEAHAAERLLQQVPSPLDQLKSEALPEGIRRLWRPFELVAVLGSYRLWHGADVTSVAFHPEGKLLASSGRNDVIRLWDVAKMEETTTWSVPAGGVYNLTFSPDGRVLASINNDHKALRLLDVATGKDSVVLAGMPQDIMFLRFAPDGKTLATAHKDRKIRLWDLETGREQGVLVGHKGEVWRLAFAPDGKFLLSAGQDHTVRVWDVADRKDVVTIKHNKPVHVMALAPDGKTLAWAGDESEVKLWDVTGNKERGVLKVHTQRVGVLEFSPDSKLLATGSNDRTVHIWDAATGKGRSTLRGHSDEITAVAFAADSSTLATASKDRNISLWDLAANRPRDPALLHWPRAAMEWFYETPDGTIQALGIQGGTLKLWDVVTGKERVAFPDCRHPFFPVMAPDQKTFLTMDRKANTVEKLWDVGTGKERSSLQGLAGPVHAVRFTADGKSVVVATEDKNVRWWEVATGKERPALRGHTAGILNLALSGNGKTLASASKDKTVRLWDLPSGQLRHTLVGHKEAVRTVAFSPDGKVLVSAGDDQTARLWDAATGQERALLSMPTRSSINFAPDSTMLATGVSDGSVRIWDAATGAQKISLPGHVGEPFWMVFSVDGKMLVTASMSGQLILWQLPSGKKLGEWLLARDAYADIAADGRHLLITTNAVSYILRLASAPDKAR